ncbi:MAG: site-specific integrase [Deltaproteobacteria bacterium]|nr:site-specific integrase [Deltaproteobacteria bacterium]
MPYKERGGYRAQIYRNLKRHSKWFPTRKAAKAWEAAKAEELDQLERQTTHTGSYLLEISTKYLDYVKVQYHKGTYSNKKLALKQLIATVGDIPADEVQPAMILHEILLKQPTAQLYNHRRKDLSTFFDYAVDFHGVKFNPVKAIKKLPSDRANQPVPTQGEYAKLLLILGPGQDRNLIITLAEAGPRRSEVFRITWSDDVDFRNRLLRLGSRKNQKRELRYRYIPMSNNLYKALQDQFRRRLSHSDYVFQNRAEWIDKNGNVTRRHPNYGQKFTARRKFIRGLCKKAGIKQFGFHGLRRYYASKLVSEGLDLETIRDRMGHHAVSVTDKYIKRIKEDLGPMFEAGAF